MDMNPAALLDSALRREDVLRLALPMPPKVVGVYFLVAHGRIIYVGQSIDIETRIRQHRATGKCFDHYHVVHTKVSDLDLVESYYIHKLEPLLNGGENNSRSNAPMSFEDVLNQLMGAK